MLDIRTLMVVTGITSLMLGAIMFATVRSYAATSRRALVIWASGLVIQPLGWFFIASRGYVPDVLSSVVGNLLIAAGFNACVHAFDVFNGRRPRHEIFAALVLLNTAVSCACMIWPIPAHLRLVGLSLTIMPVYALAAQSALAVAHPSARRPTSHWITAGIFGIGAIVLLVRSIALLIEGASGAGVMFLASRIEQFVFAYISFINIVGSFGFVLMCNDRLNAELTRLAAEDSLTGVFNRRTFEQRALLAFDRARRDARPLALLLIDGDHFKRINDEHGHAAGDAALRVYALTFREALRSGDTLGRVGGEEFSALLPGCDEGEAHAFAERLRASIEANAFAHEGRTVPLRVSVGVAAMTNADGDFETLLKRADRALYTAKRTGRNRVVAASAALAIAES